MATLNTLFSNHRLHEPVGFLDNRKEKMQFIVFVSLFSALFLILFQPFGVNNYDPTHSLRPEFLLFMALFGLFISNVLALNEFFLAPVFFQNRTALQLFIWTAWTLFLLSSALFLFYNFLGGFHDWQFSSYRGFIWDVSSMEIIPMAMAYLYFYNLRAQKKLGDLQQRHQRDIDQNALVYFESDNGKERFAVHWDQLLYLESQDNYVAVHYLQNGQLKKKLIRSTLKKQEHAFAGSSLIRCHRSFIVNIIKVIQAEGNVHQLRLTLRNGVGPLPVSRNYMNAVNRFMMVGQPSLISNIHP